MKARNMKDLLVRTDLIVDHLKDRTTNREIEAGIKLQEEKIDIVHIIGIIPTIDQLIVVIMNMIGRGIDTNN